MRLIFKKLLPLVVAVAVLFAVAPTASAEILVVDPEETATFTLEFSGVTAIEGTIEFSNPSIISNIQYDRTDNGMKGRVENGTIFLYTDGQEGVNGKIDVTVTIYSAAPKGSTCNITFQYATTEPGSNTPGPVRNVTYTVTVRTNEQATTPPTTESKPTTPTTTQPTNPKVDVSALQEQIRIAQSLTYYDYSKTTWAAVQQAVQSGTLALSSDNQAEVDKATQAIKDAIKKLVRVDYSRLQAALDSVGDMDKHEDLTAIWSRFIAALQNARVQRTSGDQAAVDKATRELLASKDELQKALEDMGDLITVEKEVPVEVEPSYDFCNITGHTVRLIVMIASLALNGVLIGLIVYYFLKKRSNQKDKTPLVEYDIADDEAEMELNDEVEIL